MLLGVVVFSCGGGEGDDCRSQSDCGDELGCAGPNDPQPCGIGPMEACASDLDCVAPSVCHAIGDVCSSDGIGSGCMPPCPDTACGEGLVCGASGACALPACGDDRQCAPHQECVEAQGDDVPVHARTGGCVDHACGADADCAGIGREPTVCVNGFCQVGPGQCVDIVVVP